MSQSRMGSILSEELHTDQAGLEPLSPAADPAPAPAGIPFGVAQTPQQALADWVRRDYEEFAARCTDQAASSWERTTCRACGAGGLVEGLSLGSMPPANALLRQSELDQPEPRFPLSLRLCERCGMAQLGHVVPPELLFRSYLFFTSSSRRMSEHFSALITEAAHEFVPPGGLIIEIGSNDGTGLASIQRRDVRVLGVDPARNISVMAAARGVPTISEFFTETLAREIARVAGRAHLVVACNVLGHIDDLDDVCRGIRTLLAPDGALVFEVPYLGELLDRAEYDTIYHEHLSYFAVRPLVHLLNRHGLQLERVEFFPVHGGTIRGTAILGTGYSPQVEEWIADEIEKGMGQRRAFEEMARKVEANRHGLRRRLAELRAAGAKVIGYGAPAKGTVVLNYCEIGTDLLPLVIDSTPAKQGCYVPGTHQPILPPSAIERERPDALLLLAWNHAEEITEREAAFRARGGRFLTPHANKGAFELETTPR
ncbi:MAG: class I SAM-dependent methyltransferase [Isosphaeraceae bacterium]|nr:class I SAM-dependent methyltransferase [Isosphaeraceae bacterium]